MAAGGRRKPLEAAGAGLCTALAEVHPSQVEIAGGKAQLCGAELLVTAEQRLWNAWFIGDAFRLRQCLINLVDNACKASRRGEGLVQVSIHTCLSSEDAKPPATSDDAAAGGAAPEPPALPGGRARHSLSVNAAHSATRLVEFSVQDSGCGIPREKQSLLFQPFSQVREHPHPCSMR